MNYFIDMHCHPSLKTYLFDKSLYEKHHASKDFDPFDMQVDLPKMEEGNVNAILAAHYLPEIGLRKYCTLLEHLFPALQSFFPKFTEKVEKDNSPTAPFEQTMNVISHFEGKIMEALDHGHQVVLAKSFTELTNALQGGKRVFIHSIEGAHSLGRNLPDANAYLQNLQAFFDKGVCMITIGHFFENDITSSVEGMPPSVCKMIGYSRPPNTKPGLSAIGEAVVKKMLDLGMIVDLTHCTPEARQRIFQLNDDRVAQGKTRRPLVFSHVGLRSLFNDPDHPNFNLMCPTDAEVLKIKECNGVIGIILVNYWLTGKEENDIPLLPDFTPDKGMDFIINTVKRINTIAGNCNNIAIGTDFDGFTDPPDDLEDPSKFPLIKKRLLAEAYSSNDVDKIMGTNVLRVLRDGWR